MDHRLKRMVGHISDEALNGLGSLAIIDNLPKQLKENELDSLGPFWKTAFDQSREMLILAVSRVTDADCDGINVASALNYMEQNRTECVWLYSSDGRAKYPDPDGQLRAVLMKWRDWLGNGALTRARTVRDKLVAHRDKDVLLKAAPIDSASLGDLRGLIEDLQKCVSDLRRLIDDTYVDHSNGYDQVSNDLEHSLEMYSIGIRCLTEHPEMFRD